MISTFFIPLFGTLFAGLAFFMGLIGELDMFAKEPIFQILIGMIVLGLVGLVIDAIVFWLPGHAIGLIKDSGAVGRILGVAGILLSGFVIYQIWVYFSTNLN